MDPIREKSLLLTRRHFFGRAATGIGAAALGSLLRPSLFANPEEFPLGQTHFQPKAKRIIYLFMAGGPSQMDLLDYKPTLETLHKTAIDNLTARSQEISAHAAQDENGNVNLILFQTMDGYDASRILLPTLHDRLKEHLGSPFAAGIPNRDILLCFRDDEETVGRLSQQISDDYQKMPHQVTDKLLLVTPDGIAPR